MSKKILIYGEYSGYGNSLVKGFRELGFKSDIFSPGKDGFKSIDVDFCLNNKSRMHQLYSMLRLIPKFLTYDVIFVMNPSFLRFKLMGPLVVFFVTHTNKKNKSFVLW
ncbi:hypothetical protein BTO00_01790 [Vibrio campbellii]|uniref:hypothetical protein n=1 Tax=Vibrio campbellii TaxID=680 RepID=UPI000CF4DD03|nr:hypothetical protein [Vibrio campbellii]PQJ44933.1 hypothetical protein BTO00_01790 [Vibrio campbellii]